MGALGAPALPIPGDVGGVFYKNGAPWVVHSSGSGYCKGIFAQKIATVC